MSTVYLRSGPVFNPADESALDIQRTLPAGNFIVKRNPMTQALYFEQVQSFPPMTGKIYGDTLKRAERIMRTYLDRPAATGVMLTGEKGSGKSLLAKLLSLAGYEIGIPTIVINTQITGDDFNKLIQDVAQNCIVLFDEFEKVYDREHQEMILTLLDGAFPTKKMFILTCNDANRIDSHMRNRPGRIFYLKEYQGLDRAFIQEYATDMLKPDLQKHIPDIIRASMVFDSFNFDMLKALVEEMNRYDETPLDAMEMLNMNPVNSGGDYEVELKTPTGELIREREYYPSGTYHGSPLGHRVVSFDWTPQEDFPAYYQDGHGIDIKFSATDIREVSESGFFYKNALGYTVKFTRNLMTKFNMSMAI